MTKNKYQIAEEHDLQIALEIIEELFQKRVFTWCPLANRYYFRLFGSRFYLTIHGQKSDSYMEIHIGQTHADPCYLVSWFYDRDMTMHNMYLQFMRKMAFAIEMFPSEDLMTDDEVYDLFKTKANFDLFNP